MKYAFTIFGEAHRYQNKDGYGNVETFTFFYSEILALKWAKDTKIFGTKMSNQ